MPAKPQFIFPRRDPAIKKLLSLFLIPALLVTLAACQRAPGKSLYAHGLDVVALLSEMAGSDAYVSLYTGNTEIGDILRAAGEGDRTTPKAVYAISISEETLISLSEVAASAEVSENLKHATAQRMLATIMTQVNASAGVETLAAASVCTAGKTFLAEGAQDCIYLYTYENACPAAVTFTTGEDGTVSASGILLLYEAFPWGSVEEIQAFFSEIPMTVTLVTES